MTASQRYRARHVEKCRRCVRENYRKHKARYVAKKKESNQRRYLRKREEFIVKNAAYYELHREQLKKKQREYRLAHLEQEKRRCREWYASKKNDPEFMRLDRVRSQVDFQKHKAKRIAKHKEWRNKNPGYFAAMNHRRRLIEKASKNLRLIKEWMKSVKTKATATCYYCASTVSTKQIHFDHIVPISKGGIHDVSNLCVSCAKCNLTKQSKTVTAWVRVGQQVLNL